MLADIAHIQIEISSDNLSGATLDELAQELVMLLNLLIVILEFLVRAGQLIGRLVSWPSRALGWRQFWSRVAWCCIG